MPDYNANDAALLCYRCGTPLAALTLPLSRRDLCPDCGVELHACRMCLHYAPGKPDNCDEEDAIPVRDAAAANFCDYFSPDANAFDGKEKRAESGARRQLADLFGDESCAPDDDDIASAQAEDLFRK